MPSSDFNLILPPRYPPLEPPLQNNLHPQIQIPNACPVNRYLSHMYSLSITWTRLVLHLACPLSKYILKLTLMHCLDLDQNDQKKRHYFWQSFHTLKNKWKLKHKREKRIVWAIMEGCTSMNRAWPISWFLKNCQNGTF